LIAAKRTALRSPTPGSIEILLNKDRAAKGVSRSAVTADANGTPPDVLGGLRG